MILIVTGLPGSGKTYLAKRLATRLQASYLSSDQIRRAMLARRTYSTAEKASVYDYMLSTATDLVKTSKNIVIDATFYAKVLREKFWDTLSATSEVYFVELRADEALIRERLLKKRIDSDADYKVYEIVKASWHPFDTEHLTLQSTNSNIETLLLQTMKYINPKP